MISSENNENHDKIIETNGKDIVGGGGGHLKLRIIQPPPEETEHAHQDSTESTGSAFIHRTNMPVLFS